MIHGVLPPLTAITNLPRADTAVLASSAMSLAASRATDSTSGKISIFITLPRLPPRTPSYRRDCPILPAESRVPLHLDPRCSGRTDIPACSFSTRVRQSATPLRHSLRAQTKNCRRPSRLQEHVHMHPFHPPAGSGWLPFRRFQERVHRLSGTATSFPWR